MSLLLDISVRDQARVQENTENDLQGSQYSFLMYQNAERVFWGSFKIFSES